MEVNIKPIAPENLYREETYRDPSAGDIIVLIPVHEDGNMDISRKMVFRGTTVLGGKVKIFFPLDGPVLSRAIHQWHAACVKAVEEFQSQAIRESLLAPIPDGQKPQA